MENQNKASKAWMISQEKIYDIRVKLAGATLRSKRLTPKVQAYKKIIDLNGDIANELKEEERVSIQTRASQERISIYRQFLGQESQES